jgi:hypothetical protein
MGRRLGDVTTAKAGRGNGRAPATGAKEMEGAPPPLRKEAGKDALPPEQRALQRLLPRIAIFSRGQVAFGNQRGRRQVRRTRATGAGGCVELRARQDEEPVLRPFSVRNSTGRAQKSEAEQRLEETGALGRQQHSKKATPSTERGERRRRWSATTTGVIDETRKRRGSWNALAERRDAQMQELSRQLNQTADEMQKAQASSRAIPGDRAERARARIAAAGATTSATDRVSTESASGHQERGTQQQILGSASTVRHRQRHDNARIAKDWRNLRAAVAKTRRTKIETNSANSRRTERHAG